MSHKISFFTTSKTASMLIKRVKNEVNDEKTISDFTYFVGNLWLCCL